jgi:hypothetical protein
MRSVIFQLWFVASLFLASHVADHYFLLVWFYGFWRVHHEGLYFNYMPSSHSIDDYVVSNGDRISIADSFISLPITLVIWAAPAAIGYFLVMRRFRAGKAASA